MSDNLDPSASLSEAGRKIRENIAAEYNVDPESLNGSSENELREDAERLREIMDYSGDGSIAEHLGRLFSRDRRVNYVAPYAMNSSEEDQ